MHELLKNAMRSVCARVHHARSLFHNVCDFDHAPLRARVLLCCARATVEEHMDNLQFMPTITITVANNDIDFLIR